MTKKEEEKKSEKARERAEQDKNLGKAKLSIVIKEVNERRDARKKTG